MAGYFKIVSTWYYVIVFAFLGVFNSVLFPTFISILANWFPKKGRGLVIGFWATCNNLGNIVGIQLSAFLLDAFNGSWPSLLLTIAITVFVWSIIIFFFLVAEPSQLGLVVQEETSEEQAVQ